jgi:hypothetical protein
MEKEKVYLSPEEQERQESVPSPAVGKKPWQEPKLVFVEPKLTKHGELEEVTGFFGTQNP